MEKKNPFAIRKSPVELISTQAVNIDDYVKKYYNLNGHCQATFYTV